MEGKLPEDFGEVELTPPDWLPDGWVMEVKRGEDGTLYQYFVSPVSGSRFSMKSEVLNYLFSEMDEHWIASKKSAERGNMLTKAHEWLPNGWQIEIRAGGENMDKMFKFYIYPEMGVRVFSKEDVLLYAKEMKITECDTDGQCDTNSLDNILALVEFNPPKLPQGWVKEIVYRKTKMGIRKDPYYTDPVSQYVFRTVKGASRFLATGNVSKLQFIQKTSVHDLYSFEKSADLHESLRKRLGNNSKDAKTHRRSPKPRRSAQREKIKCNGLTLYSSIAEDTDSDTSIDSVSPNEHENIKNTCVKTKRGESSSSMTIKRPRGRPRKVVKELMEHKEG
ncbi:uncharacterized protein [Lolium perenne]|uniref:uncharacterized protein n=1 Tax=Lolium perenne TaxID=4522 RepID=UPI0021F5AEDA|nr:uncharacterized protein LOC127338870 [Lolium perenne]